MIRPRTLRTAWLRQKLDGAGYDRPRDSVGMRGDIRDPLTHPSRAPGPHAGTDLRLNATSVRAQLALGQWLRTDEGAHACTPLVTPTTGRTLP